MSEALEITGLYRVFGLRKALCDLSLTLPDGAFLTVFGHNGAGKSTLLRILTTLDRPSKGTVKILGFDAREDADKIRAHMGYLSHNPMLYSDMTALENLLFFARLYGVPNPEIRARELLQQVELDHRRLDVVRTFSRGMVQRLSIARTLIHNPKIVFLDEPYSGLDPHATQVLDSLLTQVRQDRTCVMVSHNLAKGYEHASHILLLSCGKSICLTAKEDIGFERLGELYRQTVGQEVAS